jgi:hypothetical protein
MIDFIRRLRSVARWTAVLAPVAASFKVMPAANAYNSTCTSGYRWAGEWSQNSNYEGVGGNISRSNLGSAINNPSADHVLLWISTQSPYPNDSTWMQVGMGNGIVGAGGVAASTNGDAVYVEYPDAEHGYQVNFKHNVALDANNQFKVYNTNMTDANGYHVWQGWDNPGGSGWTQLIEGYENWNSGPVYATAEAYQGAAGPCLTVSRAGSTDASFGRLQNGTVNQSSELVNTFDGTNYTAWTGAVNTIANSPYYKNQIANYYAFTAGGN